MSEGVKRLPRIDDNTRVKKVLIELSKTIDQSSSSSESSSSESVYQIENQAKDLLLEYANELTSAVLEEACLMAKHRKSKEISSNDVNLILGIDNTITLTFILHY
jgi:transcription initiation factor TFIID subunit TAF12